MPQFEIWDDKAKKATGQKVEIIASNIKVHEPTVWTNPDSSHRNGSQVTTLDNKTLKLVEEYSTFRDRMGFTRAQDSAPQVTASPKPVG